MQNKLQVSDILPLPSRNPKTKKPTHANRNTPKALYQYVKLLILEKLELS